MIRLALLLFAAAALLPAQSPRRVQAVGTASIAITPDQVRINVGVVTSATTAAEAASQNGTQVDSVIAAVKKLLGTKGSLKTVSYSIRGDYRTVNGQSQLVGYVATNTIEVTSNDLTLIGPVIDTSVQAGANSIGSPNFTLQDAQPTIQLALTAAAKQARAHADAIAAGLGAKTGAVFSAQEGANYSPIRSDTVGAAAATPIQPGTLEISATVTIEVELQ